MKGSALLDVKIRDERQQTFSAKKVLESSGAQLKSNFQTSAILAMKLGSEL